MSREEVISKLKTHAQKTQSSVRDFDKKRKGVQILRSFWVTNAVVIKINTDKVPIDKLAELDHVTAVHDNFKVKVLGGARGSGGQQAASTTTGSHVATTYGLDQINATEVWKQYDTRGEGVKVAVLDTGVDVSHPDIELFTTNKSDPTYPGGYAAFNEDGERIKGATPSDEHGHGTHVSGTVAGGNASGEYIGVAPGVSLMHAKVIPGGSGTFAQVLAGFQWAVKNGADVISMSLGFDGHFDRFIDPAQNARKAGVVVVAAVGNSGPGSSGSPGNYYSVISVGASDSTRHVADFSSSEFINTSKVWGTEAPESWPQNYSVPDVVAPGVNVKSSVPGGYAEFDGTSMAAPHVAGTVALILSAADNNPSVDLIETALKKTAKPAAGLNQSNKTQARRDGAGIIDALAATDRVVGDANVSARLDSDLSTHAEPNHNTTATFRVSNVDTVNVTLVSESTVPQSKVSVWIDGKPANLNKTVKVGNNVSTDAFTVTVSVDSRFERAVGFNVIFGTTNKKAKTTQDTVTVGPTRIHPDPMMAGNGTARFDGKTPLANASAFATAGTTILIANGSYDGFRVNSTAASNLTMKPAYPGQVSITTRDNSFVYINASGFTLANVAVNVTLSVWVDSNATTLRNITSHSTVVFTDVVGGTVERSTITTSGVGLLVWDSSEMHIDEVAVNAEIGIEILATSDSSVSNSVLHASNGPGIAVIASDGVTVRASDIRGSNVSAGFTGAVVSAFNGLGYSESSSTTTVEALTMKQTTVGGTTLTYARFSPQQKSEFGTNATKQMVSNLRPDYLPNRTKEEAKSMNKSERRALAKSLRQQLANITNRSLDASTLEDGADSTFHDGEPVWFVGNDIQGEAAGVLTYAGVTVLRDNRITNISYPYYGVFVSYGSATIMYSNTIDTDVGTNLTSESGVTVYGWAFASLYDNKITSRTAVQTRYGGFAFLEENTLQGEVAVRADDYGWVVSYQNTLKGDVGHRVDDVSFIYTVNDTLATDVGIKQSDYGYALALFTNFTVPETAVKSEDDYWVDGLYSWWGDDDGPSATQRANIDFYDPFLTAPPSQVPLDFDKLQQFATDVVLPAGETTALSVPGPVKGNLSSMFVSDFTGVVYKWNVSSQSWRQATGEEKLGALDAVVVIPKERVRVVMDFEDASEPTVPPTKNMSQGWNFIGAPSSSNADTAFGASSASPARVIHSHEQPESQVVEYGDDFEVYTFGSDEYPPEVSAMTGYWVYAEEDGEMAANVPAGVTVDGFFDRTDDEVES